MEIQLRLLSIILILILPNLTSTHSTLLSRSPQLLSKLESKLLSLAGLASRPSSNVKFSLSDSSVLQVPRHLVELYEKSNGNLLETTNLDLPGRFTKGANTVRTFYDGKGDGEANLHFHFPINSIPANELVTGAELHISINASSSVQCPYNSLRFLINDVTRRIRPGQEPIMYAIDSRLVKTKGETNRVLSMDVFPAVARWVGNKNKNHGLRLEVQAGSVEGGAKLLEECGLRLTSPAVLFTYSDDRLYNKPVRSADVLSRKYRSVTQTQKKRGRGRKHKNRKRSLCAKHKMFVDFTDVGWNDWIVAPPGYHAHHCSGECPFPMADHLNATNHAVIQALVNSMNPQLVPPPCCVPTKYSSLSLLYTDSSDKIVLKNYSEMVVDNCGCS